ncbi:MAG: tetratricopeptide repeat protein, partial [Myxococcales bacterium]|nr:tetratricopeptide repeat protein [Myxococcales bacterium]
RRVLEGADGDLDAGTQVGAYVIDRKLGEGGLGVVYLAKDADGVEVAVKVIRPGFARDRSSVRRFLTVTRALRAAHVHGVVDVLALGELEDGRPWVATAYLPGQTLAARIARSGPMHIQEARQIFAEILETLAKLHQRGLVHGHVKAENVVLAKGTGGPGDAVDPILVDGGSDRLAARRYSNGAGVVPLFGTAKSLDPAVVRGSDRSPETDLYAVAVMLYETLAGRPPFVGATAMDVVALQLVSEPERPSAHAPQGWVPPSLDEFVLRALSKDPAKRFGSAADFLRGLEEVSTRKSSLVPASPLDQAAFDQAAVAFANAPADAALAESIEQIVAPANAWDHAVSTFVGAAKSAEDPTVRKALMLRIGRIHRIEQGDLAAAKEAYEAAVALDPTDRDAQTALLELLRASGDAEALVEFLLERAESEETPGVRSQLLEEIARTYEEKLDSVDSALIAWVHALGDSPERSEYVHEIERLATTPELWNEVVSALNESATEADGTPAAASLYLILGRWYAGRLQHPDFALQCFAKALEADPANDDVYEATAQVYRKTQNWRELIQLFERRAAMATNPARARNLRADAAKIVLDQLGDDAQAEALLDVIAHEDPAHPQANELLELIYTRAERWAELARILERRASSESGDSKAATLVRAGELFEDRMDDLRAAATQYEKALEADAGSFEALKGLERVFAREGKYRELHRVLERELAVAATPKQKASILERKGAIEDEEFNDRDRATKTYESILEFDAANDGANAALERIYRQTERWVELGQLFERHARSVHTEPRKVELLVKAAEVFGAKAAQTSRAVTLVQSALEIDPDHTRALEMYALLQTSSGDRTAAVTVMDRLAEGETDAKKRAGLWLKAGKLREEKGDREGASDRFKKALDADPNHTDARQALRQLYADAGDAYGAIELLQRDIEQAQGELQRAKLYAELGQLYAERLSDKVRAKATFDTAIQLDPTCALAAMGLGDLAFDNGEWVVAVHHYEPLLSRLSALSADSAKRMCIRCGDCFRALKDFAKAERAYINARSIAAEDREVIERLADLAFEAGSFDEAVEFYRDFDRRFGAELVAEERALVLVRLGESLAKSGQRADAIQQIEAAAKLAPTERAPYEALAGLYESEGKWAEALQALETALGHAADDAERFEVLVRMGDLAFAKANDAKAALKHYQAALQIRGDARNVLTKLMAIYSETKSWSDLVEVILRIADLVDDRAQLSKYFRTVASIYLSELKKVDEAAHYYAEAIENDPESDDAFKGLASCLEQKKDFTALAAAYKDQIVRLGKGADPKRRATLWEGLGRAYAQHLNDLPAAIDAFEKALVLVPGESKYIDELVALYERDVPRYGEKARVIHDSLLRSNPLRVQSFQSLYRVYRQQGNVDGAWCVAQSLRCQGQADADEKEFFKSRRRKSTLGATSTLDGQGWRSLVVHPDQDALLTAIFTTITPVVLQKNAESLASYGVAESDRIADSDTAPMAQALRYASWLAEIPLPSLYRRANDQGGLSYLFTAPPGIGLGAGAYVSLPSHVVGFVAARHLAYLQPGHYVRYLVPTGTGLKSWLLAAIRVAQPAFPVPAEVESQVAEFQAALLGHLPQELRTVLEKLVESLLANSPSLDLKRWIAAVDKTADRFGFVMANDLEHSIAVIAASPEESSTVGRDERIRELQAYAASSQYIELRRRLGAQLDA